jgi:stage V sporulation protein G
MEITDVRIYLRNEEKLKAYVTITFDDCFVIRNLKIIKGNKGMFVAMPSRTAPDGKRFDIVHPITQEMRGKLEKKVLGEYEKQVQDMAKDAQTPLRPAGSLTPETASESSIPANEELPASSPKSDKSDKPPVS